MAHSFEVGTGVWQPDATEGWVASEVQQKVVKGDQVKLVFKLANGSVSREMPLDRMKTPDVLTRRQSRPKHSRRPWQRCRTRIMQNYLR